MDESNRLLPGRCEFDARQVHQKNASQSEAFWNAFCPGDKAGGRADSNKSGPCERKFFRGELHFPINMALSCFSPVSIQFEKVKS